MKKDPFKMVGSFLMAAPAMLILTPAGATATERASSPQFLFTNVHIFDGLSVVSARDRD